MQLTVESKSTKTIEVETPSFYKRAGSYIAITESCLFMASESTSFIATYSSKHEESYAHEVEKTVSWGTPCTREQFENCYNNVLKCLAEQYRASINMTSYIEPKEGQQQEGATQAEPAADLQAATPASEETPEEGE